MTTPGKVLLLLTCLTTCVAAVVAVDFLHSRTPTGSHDAVLATVAAELTALQHVGNSTIETRFLDLGPHSARPMTNVKRIEIGACRIKHDHASVDVFLIDSEDIVTPCEAILIYESDEWKLEHLDIKTTWPKTRHMAGHRA